MKPLDPLSRSDGGRLDEPAPIERLLREAAPAAVRTELARLDGLDLAGPEAASPCRRTGRRVWLQRTVELSRTARSSRCAPAEWPSTP